MDDKVRCPQCQTTRLRVLKKLDRIERLHGSRLLNHFRARRGDTIYHCIYCRLQFYDPRKPKTAEAGEEESRAPDLTEPEPAENGHGLLQHLTLSPDPGESPPELPHNVAARNGGAATFSVGTPVTKFGAQVYVRGSIEADEDIYVDGRVDGTVTADDHRIVIGPHGDVKGNLRAAEVEIRGTLRGHSHVRGRITLCVGSKVLGDIRTHRIAIEEGARFNGSVDPIREQPRLPLA